MAPVGLLAVFVGGGAGAVCRYGAGHFVATWYRGAFPLGTFLINVSGCFALGAIASVLAVAHRDPAIATALLATGFLGGYTTFSTYALETTVLLRARRTALSLTYLLGSIALGMIAAAAGAGVVHLLGLGG